MLKRDNRKVLVTMERRHIPEYRNIKEPAGQLLFDFQREIFMKLQ